MWQNLGSWQPVPHKSMWSLKQPFSNFLATWQLTSWFESNIWSLCIFLDLRKKRKFKVWPLFEIRQQRCFSERTLSSLLIFGAFTVAETPKSPVLLSHRLWGCCCCCCHPSVVHKCTQVCWQMIKLFHHKQVLFDSLWYFFGLVVIQRNCLLDLEETDAAKMSSFFVTWILVRSRFASHASTCKSYSFQLIVFKMLVLRWASRRSI